MPGMKGLLKRPCAIGRRRDGLAESTLKTYRADLNRRLDRPDGLKTPDGCSGRACPSQVVARSVIRSVTPRRYWLA
jgi:hypothetical protein